MDNRESNSQPEFREDNIAESMVEMLYSNSTMTKCLMLTMWKLIWKTSSRPTSPQMSDEQTLATFVGDSTESESVCSDEEDEDEKLVSTKEAVPCFKKYLSWMESQNDIDPVQLMQLR